MGGGGGGGNVPCVAEVVNRSLKADYTDLTNSYLMSIKLAKPHYLSHNIKEKD